MSLKFEDPFANISKENEEKVVGKKALWESVKITEKLSEVTDDKEQTNPSMAIKGSPDKLGKTIDASMDSQRIKNALPQPEEEDDKYIKGTAPLENDIKREEIRKKQNIDKSYS